MCLLSCLTCIQPDQLGASPHAQAMKSASSVWDVLMKWSDVWGKLKETHYWSGRNFLISATVVSLFRATFFHLCSPCDFPRLLHLHWSVHSSCLLWSAPRLVSGFDTIKDARTHANTHSPLQRHLWHQRANYSNILSFVCAYSLPGLPELNVCLPV